MGFLDDLGHLVATIPPSAENGSMIVKTDSQSSCDVVGNCRVEWTAAARWRTLKPHGGPHTETRATSPPISNRWKDFPLAPSSKHCSGSSDENSFLPRRLFWQQLSPTFHVACVRGHPREEADGLRQQLHLFLEQIQTVNRYINTSTLWVLLLWKSLDTPP